MLKALIRYMKFFNPTKGALDFEKVVREISDYIEEGGENEVIVGCDSSSSSEPIFPIVIVVLKKGRGGRFFIRKTKYRARKFYSTKERIMEEVFLSCKVALELKEKLDFKDVFYIHADIGKGGKTKDMIKEVVNFIQGNGFKARIKPESFVAYSIADRYT